MYYIKKLVFFVKKNIFNYFDGSGSGSGYPRIIEYRDGYPKPGYPETTNLDPDIKFTDLDTLNFPDIWIRPRATSKGVHISSVFVICGSSSSPVFGLIIKYRGVSFGS